MSTKDLHKKLKMKVFFLTVLVVFKVYTYLDLELARNSFLYWKFQFKSSNFPEKFFEFIFFTY